MPDDLKGADLEWLRDQIDTGHCGEGIFERQGRDRHNERIERILAALAHLSRIQEENERLRVFAGLGCDANDGGAHNPEAQGRYRFCLACGETLRAKRASQEQGGPGHG